MDLWLCLSLVAAIGIVYGRTVQFDFVNWDDPWYVVNNEIIKSWHPSNLYKVATTFVTRNYAPVTITSYLIEHTIWGLWPGGYHLTNIVIHAINAVLVYVLIVQLTGNRYVGWVTAALFALHPIQIETAAWISSRKGLLSGAFMLAALICWLRPERSAKHELWGLAFLALALMSKALAVVVPPIVLSYDVLICRRQFAESLVRQIVPGIMAFLLLVVTMNAQVSSIGGVRDHLSLTKLQILGVDSVILWRYIGMLIYPGNLCVLYDPPTSGIALEIAFSVAGWILVAALIYRCRYSHPLIAFAAVTAITLMIPILNLFPITTLMNDRYLYLPSIAVFAVAVAGLETLFRSIIIPATDDISGRHSLRRMLQNCTAGAGIAFYGLLTIQHLPVWQNPRSLWEHTQQHVPQLAVVQIQYANMLHAEGDNKQARSVLETALAQLDPDPADRKRILEKLSAWP
jgi:hypothetical protein